MRKVLAYLVAGSLVASCGGNASSAPTIALAALVTVEYRGMRLSATRLTGRAEFSETAGLSANVDSIQMRMFTFSAEQRVEMGAAQIVQAAGSNRIQARGTLFVDFGFAVTTNLFSRLVMVARTTDARGNAMEIMTDLTDCRCIGPG